MLPPIKRFCISILSDMVGVGEIFAVDMRHLTLVEVKNFLYHGYAMNLAGKRQAFVR